MRQTSTTKTETGLFDFLPTGYYSGHVSVRFATIPPLADPTPLAPPPTAELVANTKNSESLPWSPAWNDCRFDDRE